MNIYLESIHSHFVDRVSCAVLTITGDQAPGLRLVGIANIVKFLALRAGVARVVASVAPLVITLPCFLFHFLLMKYKFNIDLQWLFKF